MNLAPETTMLIALSVLLAVIIIPIWALINIMTKNKFEYPSDKIGWVLIVLFLPIIGSIIYISVGQNKPKD